MRTPGGWLKRTIYLDERRVETQAGMPRELAQQRDTTISALVRQALDQNLLSAFTLDQLRDQLTEPRLTASTGCGE